ncbi:protein btn-1 precursor, putative [Entamoeba invadens IP1]|uniref:Battenin n=1 Tax=Entamoeba invadens IP1 TaxID=370355 RepID=A0A0A1UAK7_ENTIV|nr:protein btn-1 precursor, putative [Entamoeba invadens IP1]ELP92103.1 protein btn-1 precursor, putative [Entamoeba invadens IP1]|eukprot:XP_004258874.1 protein btn-1 precursor, putative [Entamoeba invadens IP1]
MVNRVLKFLHLTKGWDYYRNYLGFFIIGTINNINFVVVNSSASSLCSFFHADALNPLVLWCNTFAGLILRIFNMLFLYKIPIKIRLLFSTIFNLIGLFGIVLAILLQEYTQSESYVLFGLALCMILVIGGVQSFAESVILSYSGRFPSEMVNGWSSGTGFAGVAGSGLYLFYSGLNVPDTISFTTLTPLCVIYALVFFFMIKPPTPEDLLANEKKAEKQENAEASTPSESKPLVIDNLKENAIQSDEIQHGETQESHSETSEQREVHKDEKGMFADEEKEEGTFWQKLLSGIKLTWWLGINLSLVYFFEYIINPSAIYVSMDREAAKTSDNFFLKNFYEILAFCYQLGVFISRSSLPLFKLKPVWILTIFQFSLCVLMCVQGAEHFMVDEWGIGVMIGILLIVGLIGGCAYVQVMYWILKKKMKKEQREMGMTFVTIMNTCALLCSSALALLLNETIWKNNFKE